LGNAIQVEKNSSGGGSQHLPSCQFLAFCCSTRECIEPFAGTVGTGTCAVCAVLLAKVGSGENHRIKAVAGVPLFWFLKLCIVLRASQLLPAQPVTQPICERDWEPSVAGFGGRL
jgi:hypothetical protein